MVILKAASRGWSTVSYTHLDVYKRQLTGSTVTPDQVAEWSESTGHAAYGNGSYHSLIPDALAHYGLTVQRAGTSVSYTHLF